MAPHAATRVPWRGTTRLNPDAPALSLAPILSPVPQIELALGPHLHQLRPPDVFPVPAFPHSWLEGLPTRILPSREADLGLRTGYFTSLCLHFPMCKFRPV